MFKNYFKIALRNLIQNKGHSFINIFGLAVGLTVCILILLWIQFQLSIDRFHEDVQDIQMVLAHGTAKNNPHTPAPLAPALEAEIPEILEATRYDGFPEVILGSERHRSYENRIRAVDPSFFRIFSFPFAKGNKDSALNNHQSIVITENIARKYFPGENPMGKTLIMDNQRVFTVTGILKNLPPNSTFQFDIAIPYEIRILENRERGWELDWNSFSPRTFIKLKPSSSIKAVNEKIAGFLQKHNEREDAVLGLLSFADITFFFTDTEKYIYIFSAIAFFILLIACINFMNLATSRSSNRAKEIGVRKVIGAHPGFLIKQFLGESLFTSFIALILALILVNLLIPLFNSIIGIELSPDRMFEPLFAIGLFGLALLTGILAGSYPAFFLASTHTISVLKGRLKTGIRGQRFRKTMVILQFSVSVILIVGTLIINRQLDLFKKQDIGYDRKQIVSVSLKGESRKYYQRLKDELLRDRNILGVSGSAVDMPYFGWSSGTAGWEGKDPETEVLTYNNIVDFDFVETLNIKLVAGRSFSREFSSDIGSSYMINQKMAELMQDKFPVGHQLTYWKQTGTIIGVMKDFNFKPLDTQIEPLVLILNPDQVSSMLIKIAKGKTSSALKRIQNTWDELVPMYPFTYTFLDDDFNMGYRGVEEMGVLLSSFSILAVMIACLGLFGLSSMVTIQRTKEIGIRKVLGASVPDIAMLLSAEFLKCVLIANLIAWPIAFILMRNWLHEFAYRASISIWTFLLSGLLAMVIALMTVSLQSIRAATANPVVSLRYE